MMAIEEHQAAAAALGTEILTDATCPEEEVVFSEDELDEDDGDDSNDMDPPPSLTKSVTSPATPTPLKRKIKKKHEMIITHNNDDAGLPVRKLDYSPAVRELRAKKGNEEKKLLGDLESIRIRATASTVVNSTNDSSGKHIKRRRLHWMWSFLATMFLFLLFLFAVLVYRDPTLLQQLQDYIEAVPHARYYKIQLHATQHELAQAVTDSSYLRIELESFKDQAQQDRRNHQIAQAKLKSTEEKLQMVMAKSNSTEQANMDLRDKLHQALIAKEKAEAEIEQRKHQLSDAIQQYSSERALRVALEFQKEQAVAQAREYRHDLEALQAQASTDPSESTITDQDLLIGQYQELKEIEETKIMKALEQFRKENEQKMHEELRSQREEQELELRRSIEGQRQEQLIRMMADMELLRAEQEERIVLELQLMRERRLEELSNEMKNAKSNVPTMAPGDQLERNVSSRVEKVQDKVIAASESLIAAGIQTPETVLLKGSFKEGESVLSIPRVLKEGLPRFVNNTRTEVVGTIQYLSETGVKGVVMVVGRKTAAGVALIGNGPKLVVSAAATKIVDSEGMTNAGRIVQKSVEHASTSLSEVKVQSSQSAILKGAFKEGESIFAKPQAVKRVADRASKIAKTATAGLSRTVKERLQYAQGHGKSLRSRIDQKMGRLSTASKIQFDRAKDSAMSNVGALLKTVEVRLDENMIAGVGKLDRGKDSLLVMGQLVGYQAKNTSKTLISVTKKVTEASAKTVKIMGIRSAGVATTALFETKKAVGSATKATKVYIGKRAEVVVSNSKELLASVGTMRKATAYMISQQGAMIALRSKESFQAAFRNGTVAAGHFLQIGSERISKAGKSLHTTFENAKNGTVQSVVSGSHSLQTNLEKGSKQLRALTYHASLSVGKSIQIGMSDSKDIGRKIGSTVGTVAKKVSDLGERGVHWTSKVLEEDLRPRFLESKRVAQKAGIVIGKTIMAGRKKAFDGRRILRRRVEEAWKHGVSKYPEIRNAIGRSRGELRSKTISSARKVTNTAVQGTRKLISKTLMAIKDMNQMVKKTSEVDEEDTRDTSETERMSGIESQTLGYQLSEEAYTEEARSLSDSRNWEDSNGFESVIDDGFVFTEPDSDFRRIPSIVDWNNDDAGDFDIPEGGIIEGRSQSNEDGMGPHQEIHIINNDPDSELSY
ncbi:hypothetical protein IV203_013439 [Nitzschia inconspicua]|uniref:Uncharacterized protein n=1 Tax=Nitzschia inconspicua TaxID=303405 RepID=A0A9K3M545_9STRA|nr:hypothetical protein IV203_013439 [Nitzschia inconspicua]